MHPNNFINKQALKLEIRKEMRENGVKPSTKMVNEILTDILNQIGIRSCVVVKRHCEELKPLNAAQVVEIAQTTGQIF